MLSYQDQNGIIWAGLDDGISKLNENSKFKIYDLKSSNLNSRVRSLNVYQDHLYVGTNVDLKKLVLDNNGKLKESFIQIGKEGLGDLYKELERQVSEAPRGKTIKTALEKNSMFIQVKNLEEAIEINNLVGPEHLQIIYKNFKESLLKRFIAGAIFVGENNTAVLGDYAAGPSHVIPTNSAARFSSPVSIEDFLVRTSVTEIKSIKNKAKYNELLDHSIFLAELEGLHGHAYALKLRRK